MTIHYSWFCDNNSLKSNLIDNNNGLVHFVASRLDVFFLLGLIHESRYFILGTVSVEESMLFLNLTCNVAKVLSMK